MNLLDMQPQLTSNIIKKTLLVLNGLILSIGTCGGAKNIWLLSWFETNGWPIILLPILILFLMKPPLRIASTLVGVLTGLEDYLYAYGVAKLPVSTSTLIQGIELALTAGFAFLLVKQKFTAHSVNVILPLTITYPLVKEIQLVTCFFATAFCTINCDSCQPEAREFKFGEINYYLVLVSNATIWQCFFLGSIGVASWLSSLGEKLQVEKGVALALSLWGFVSYFYGEKRRMTEDGENLIEK
ncbi:hypothetical protein PVL29_023168 [Vitis rotundifolia]|uniref:Uncharacterized protein n=1 Tax=Vitis rotundifolia TaxID=103349 RepID=A0AA38YN55_VITRO|nr:hypothetical protein PVL29_023168 [Vitis rotundifolia]